MSINIELSLDQAHDELKSAGIAADKLRRKGAEMSPDSPIGRETDRQLVSKLRYMRQLIDVILEAYDA